ncbi:MAG: DUF368 domain-containing protein [Eubacteriales bacterium]|nr:DUF368 domain-containing protein [Eubacteriales bacterium]
MNTLAYTLFGGFSMALADSVPGVSGGTVAFIMGFYDRFIGALDALVYGNWRDKLTGLMYLLRLGAGWIAGMLLAATALAGAFTTGIYKLSSMFLGFVVVSIPIIVAEQRSDMRDIRRGAVFFLIGSAVVAALTAVNLSSLVNSLGLNVWTVLYVAAAGMLAISAMVLPGISGSSLLMSFGLYLPVISAVRDLLVLRFDRLWMLAALAAGIAAGLAVSPHILKRLMERDMGAVMYLVLGMMVSSLYAIVVGPTTLKIPQHAMTLSDFSIGWFIAGAAAVLALSALKSRAARRQAVSA